MQGSGGALQDAAGLHRGSPWFTVETFPEDPKGLGKLHPLYPGFVTPGTSAYDGPPSPPPHKAGGRR